MGSNADKEFIRSITELIVRSYAPKKIILFGSYAHGEPTDESDIDLLIIKDTDKKPIERWMEVKRIVREASKLIPISPLVYNEKEFEERIALRDYFLEEVIDKGTVLYG